MAHSKEAHGKHNAMGQFNGGHYEKKHTDVELADGRYTQGEMENPEHLKKSVDMLASYAKKHKMGYP